MNNERDFLIHHGVKGQKWGVRRYQNKDGSLTEEGRKRYNWNENRKDTIIDKGTNFYRVSLKPVENIKGVRKYVNLDKDDTYWKDMFVNFYGKKYGNNVWSHVYESTKDIKVSSIESSKKLFDEMVKDPSFEKKVNDQIKAHQDLTGANKVESDTLQTKFFKSFGMDNDASRMYIAQSMKNGYDAMADIYGVMSQSPTATIVYDPDNTLNLKESNLEYKSPLRIMF